MAISSDVIRGYNDTMILYLLLDKPSYGYEISKQIKTLSNEKYVIKETTLYSAFTRMERNGYIESFSNQDNARKFSENANLSGYPATMIRYRNGFTAVGVCPSDRLTDAYHSLKQVRESGFCPDAWILNNR